MGLNQSKVLITAGVGVGVTTGLFLYLFFGSSNKNRIRDPLPIMGLRNSGSTCFLNSLLQALSSCEYFIKWLAEKDQLNGTEAPTDILESYARLSYPMIAVMYRALLVINRDLVTMDDDDEVYMSKIPRDVISTLRKHGLRIKTTEEQDSFEFFQFIIGKLQEEVEKSVRRGQLGSLDCILDEEDASEVSGELISDLEANEVDVNVMLGHIPGPGGEGANLGARCGWEFMEPFEPPKAISRVSSTRKVLVFSSYKTAPQSPFKGILWNTLQCVQCLSFIPPKLEPFDALTLPLPELKHGEEYIDLYKLIDDNFKPTMVSQVDCDGCSKKLGRKTKSVFSKKMYISRLPKILCLHILRTSWTGEICKRNERVSVMDPLNLDTIPRPYDKPSPREWSRRRESNEDKLRRFRLSQYRLVAVISHYGDPQYGHFVTYRRSPSNSNEQIWWCISDENVQPVTFFEMMQTTVYMMFYEKIFVDDLW